MSGLPHRCHERGRDCQRGSRRKLGRDGARARGARAGRSRSRGRPDLAGLDPAPPWRAQKGSSSYNGVTVSLRSLNEGRSSDRRRCRGRRGRRLGPSARALGPSLRLSGRPTGCRRRCTGQGRDPRCGGRRHARRAGRARRRRQRFPSTEQVVSRLWRHRGSDRGGSGGDRRGCHGNLRGAPRGR